MKTFLAIPILALAAAGLSACSAAQAKGPATRPAMEVPPPPPRIVEPMVAEPPPPIEPVADLPPPPATSSRPRPAASRENASREPAKTEPKPAEPPPAETAPPTPPPANPAPQIRTPADNSETARQVRDILDRANKGLSTVDYRALTPQRKESYDTAKQFILQAEDAVKVSNFQYAKYLAEKADTLAKELQGR
jgi:hypothetical protein